MRRISDADLRTRLHVQLTCLKGPTKTALQHIRGEIAVKNTVDIIMDQVIAGAIMVVPDDVSNGDWGRRPGRFGVTEPWPPGLEPEAPPKPR